jgi:hypothetical protein
LIYDQLLVAKFGKVIWGPADCGNLIAKLLHEKHPVATWNFFEERTSGPSGYMFNFIKQSNNYRMVECTSGFPDASVLFYRKTHRIVHNYQSMALQPLWILADISVS